MLVSDDDISGVELFTDASIKRIVAVLMLKGESCLLPVILLVDKKTYSGGRRLSHQRIGISCPLLVSQQVTKSCLGSLADGLFRQFYFPLAISKVKAERMIGTLFKNTRLI